ncbi:MAG: DUF1501 domain-containing protein, partial [Gammaproteobacteria bacterium]|nr:DUF1501 domain-containing protein [Gammaproteobacteria bacterium]
YGHYQALRPDIGIDRDFASPFGMAANDIPMSLHPAFDGLLAAHRDKLAVFPATHSGPFSNTSHFYQYDFFGSGLYVGQQYADGKGWIGRHLERKYLAPAEGITAYDFSGGQFKLTRGNSFVLGLSNPTNLNLGTTEVNGFKIWDDIKGFTNPTGYSSQSKYAAEQTNLFDSVFPRLKSEVDFGRIAPVEYPTASVGTNFKRTADMLLGMPELEVVHISYGGFDTHSDQVTAGDTTSGRHANILAGVSDAMTAFYDDLLATNPALHDNVTVVVMTEFGRTAKQNNNLGTDHAQASSWMAFGPHVKGGIYGDYPGLAPADLESGRYLKQTVDYRDILSEVMGPQGMGLSQADANNLFPNYNGATTPLGFMV